MAPGRGETEAGPRHCAERPDRADRAIRIGAGSSSDQLVRVLEGVSLTVAGIDDRSFTVSLIPETLERTNLGAAEPGTRVNLEVDVLAKYVEKLVAR